MVRRFMLAALCVAALAVTALPGCDGPKGNAPRIKDTPPPDGPKPIEQDKPAPKKPAENHGSTS